MQSDFLGLILVAQGAISREDLFAGLRRQTQTGEMLGKALIGLGVLNEEALAAAVAVQVGAPLFRGDWLSADLPDTPCDIPAELDLKVLHLAEGVEIWGVRTPAGRDWLEVRAESVDVEVGIYVLPDRAWEPIAGLDAMTETSNDSLSVEDGPLQLHAAIEAFYEAEDFDGLVRCLGRALGDMFSSVSTAIEDDSEFKLSWKTEAGLEFEHFERCQSIEGWQIDEARQDLKSMQGPHGWRLHYCGGNAAKLVGYVFDDVVDDPLIFDELTREFESAHKLLMERVISG